MNSPLFLTLTLAAFSVSITARAAEPHVYTAAEYINQYASIAVSEMMRTGVPASITLAQGIAESSLGNSRLVREANNHFGIKCNSEWKGDSFAQEDDDYNAEGALTKSCFRKYSNAEQSYRDHSDFIAKRARYSSLFALDRSDYKNWAKGLQTAGYATLQTYANILIANIERYELYKYDAMTKVPSSAMQPQIVDNSIFINTIDFALLEEIASETGVYMHNRLRMIVADVSDTPESIAFRFKLDAETVRGYNDLSATDNLIPFQFVYLQPKRHFYKGRTTLHVVQPNENIYLIAQVYGIKVSHLRAHNGLSEGDEPMEQSLIYLNGEAPARPLLRATSIVKNAATPQAPRQPHSPMTMPLQSE